MEHLSAANEHQPAVSKISGVIGAMMSAAGKKNKKAGNFYARKMWRGYYCKFLLPTGGKKYYMSSGVKNTKVAQTRFHMHHRLFPKTKTCKERIEKARETIILKVCST